MPRTLVDAESAARVDCDAARDLAALEEILEKEAEFARAVGDVLFVLEAPHSCHLPRRGCFRRRVAAHRPF